MDNKTLKQSRREFSASRAGKYLEKVIKEFRNNPTAHLSSADKFLAEQILDLGEEAASNPTKQETYAGSILGYLRLKLINYMRRCKKDLTIQQLERVANIIEKIPDRFTIYGFLYDPTYSAWLQEVGI